MWLTLGALFLAGTSIGTISLLLPHPSQFDEGAIWSNLALAAVASLACILGSRRLPAWSGQLGAVGGTLVITRAIYYSHDPSFYTFFYVWVGLFAFFFFGREWGVFHMAVVGIAYGWVLIEIEPSAAVARWVMTVATVAAGGDHRCPGTTGAARGDRVRKPGANPGRRRWGGSRARSKHPG